MNEIILADPPDSYVGGRDIYLPIIATEPVNQVAAFYRLLTADQRQQAEAEQKARHALLRELVALAQERGYQIIAAPQIEEGKLVAVWGVAPLAR